MYKCTMYEADNRQFKEKRTREDAFFLPLYINFTSYIVPSYINFTSYIVPSYINFTSYIVPSYIFLAIFRFLFAYMQKKLYLCTLI